MGVILKQSIEIPSLEEYHEDHFLEDGCAGAGGDLRFKSEGLALMETGRSYFPH